MNALLALFTRSLRQDVRAKSTYWARAALIGVLLLMLFNTHNSMGWIGAPGLEFFQSLIGANFFFLSLAGLSFFASAITEEKEEMTLGLLRMTNLNPLSILLGKSTSRLFGALMLLAAQLPFTLLAVSFGGISLLQIFSAYTALAGYLVFLSSLALLASVMCRRTATASFLTGLGLFVYFFGATWIGGIHWLLTKALGWAPAGPLLQGFLGGWNQLSPRTRYAEVLRTGFSGSPLCFQLFGNLALGLVLFLIAWALFNVFCRDQNEVAPPRGLLNFKFNSKRRGGASRLFGASRPWKHALIWKDFYFMAGGKTLVYAKLILYPLLVWACAAIFFRRQSGKTDWEGISVMSFFLMATLLVLELGIVAGVVFRQERRWQTLSSLAMLPMSMHRVAYQKMLGVLFPSWPTLLYIFASLGGMFLAVRPSLLKHWSAHPAEPPLYQILHQIQWEGIAGFFCVMAWILFFLHLVARLSLGLKWGALPLGFGLSVLGLMLGGPLIFGPLNEGGLVVFPIVVFGMTATLHVGIGTRLRALAAEE